MAPRPPSSIVNGTPSIGIRVSGIHEARKHLGFIQHQIGVWARSQIGAVSTEVYSHWIEKGFYFGGRPGRTRARHFLENAQKDLEPMIRGAVAESLVAGSPDASRTAVALSDRAVTLAQGYAPEVSGRLRAGIQRLRGGRFFPV